MSKLKSRKLWAAIAGVVAGLAIVFGLDENVITTISGAVVSVASVITYVMVEGNIDAAAVAEAATAVQDAISVVVASDDDDLLEEDAEGIQDLSALTIAALKTVAKEVGVTGYSTMIKSEIITAIEEASSND